MKASDIIHNLITNLDLCKKGLEDLTEQVMLDQEIGPDKKELLHKEIEGSYQAVMEARKSLISSLQKSKVL